MSRIFEDTWEEIRFNERLQQIIAKHPTIDPAYINTATSCILKRQKMFIEKMWPNFKPYADSNFDKKIKIKGEFLSRCWEMVVANTFLSIGYNLEERSSDFGPDIKISSFSPNVWVEAVSCTPGTGVDAVPDIVYAVATNVPIDEMLLRIGNGIVSKFRKYESYLLNGVIKDDEPFVIALSKGSVGHVDGHPPLIVRYLFGVGDQALRIPINFEAGEKINGSATSYFTRQRPIMKKKGDAVPVAFFEDSAHTGVSAVIYCQNHILNHPLPLGTDFVLLRNPNARVPLPEGFLPIGAEWIPSGGKIVYEEKNFISQSNAFGYLDDQTNSFEG